MKMLWAFERGSDHGSRYGVVVRGLLQIQRSSAFCGGPEWIAELSEPLSRLLRDPDAKATEEVQVTSGRAG